MNKQYIEACEAFNLDPVHINTNPFTSEMSQYIFHEKYKAQNSEAVVDASPLDMFKRVTTSVIQDKTDVGIMHAMLAGLFMPAGRILAGAGTSKRVTLINCYVNNTVEDNMVSIMDSLKNSALTMQQGGGIGIDFSTIRPTGALLRRTGSNASGPLPFMDMWDSMCKTIMSAGSRRGAMMGVLNDTHPDLLEFVKAKQIKGRMLNFNISIAISDAFMHAVKDNALWQLYFHTPPGFERKSELVKLDFEDEEGIMQYVYAEYEATHLWEIITKSTYEYSEPGVLFIDRINDLNNLNYCEEIAATNPCGEQALPPYGACCLGAVNLARMVKNPYTPEAEFDSNLLNMIVSYGIKFLDGVLDETNYPLQEQKEEAQNKRRIGLSTSGVADMLAMLGIKYGSGESIRLIQKIKKDVAITAYQTSIDMAKNKGAFPLWDKANFNRIFVENILGEMETKALNKYGLRNGVLLTDAPTGTTSLLYGNISSGIEPVFAHKLKRKILQTNNTFKEFVDYGYGIRAYAEATGSALSEIDLTSLPDYMVTMKDLSVMDHINVQAACQKYVDACISKTINCPADMEYGNFSSVYTLAYFNGCKGCTTYRPSNTRGSILEDISTKASQPEKEKIDLKKKDKRANFLEGITRKIPWQSMSASLYLTVNVNEGGPYEVFISSKDGRFTEWMTAITILISAHLRLGGSLQYVADELKQVGSQHDAGFQEGKFYKSLVQRIGYALEEITNVFKDAEDAEITPDKYTSIVPITIKETELLNSPIKGETCPICMAPTLVRQEGCEKCVQCGHEKCG